MVIARNNAIAARKRPLKMCFTVNLPICKLFSGNIESQVAREVAKDCLRYARSANSSLSSSSRFSTHTAINHPYSHSRPGLEDSSAELEGLEPLDVFALLGNNLSLPD
jgi:hypothetical protein